MPNFKTHVRTSTLVGAGAGFLGNIILQLTKMQRDPSRKFSIGELFGWTVLGGAAGGAFGILPDLLEPADCPSHRGFCHSYLAAAGITYGLHVASKADLSEHQQQFVVVAGVSYLSHLMLDAETPAGLPVI